MSQIPLQKRPNDLFISYGHADKMRVDPIVGWLQDSAGLEVWYDAVSGDASKRTTTLLANAIQSARGSLFILSSNWKASTWCGDEHEFALTERRSNESYLLLAIQIEDQLDIPQWFKIANVLNFSKFDAGAAASLLRSLNPNPSTRLDNSQDIYFAGPWSRPSSSTKFALHSMQPMGWRLVGDSPDHPHFQDALKRIASIISSSRGLVAVLPYDKNRPPNYTSPYILEEVRISQNCGRPYLLLAESNVHIPQELISGAFSGTVILLDGDAPDTSLNQTLMDFDDELSRQSHSDSRAFSFLATSLLGDRRETDDMISVIEQASNMPCLLGQGFTGQHVQQAIIDRIRTAAFVIADVTDDNRNSLIEAGIALGADTPLHLLSQRPSEGSLKRRFMFEDKEMNWYNDPLERLGTVYRIAKMYRRRVLKP